MTFPRPGVAVSLHETQPLHNVSVSDTVRDFLRLMPLPESTDPELLDVVLGGTLPKHYIESGGLSDRYLPYVRETQTLFGNSRFSVPYWVGAAAVLEIPVHEVVSYSGRFHASLSMKAHNPQFAQAAALACLAKYREYA